MRATNSNRIVAAWCLVLLIHKLSGNRNVHHTIIGGYIHASSLMSCCFEFTERMLANEKM